MARLPQAADLQRRPTPSETPGISVGAIDYGAEAAGYRAIGEGVQHVGRGINAYLNAQAEVDDYETRKKLLDFKLKSEMAHEDMLRQMPVGGQGYPEQWQKTYSKLAKEFVGTDDGNIPQSQRAKVGLALKQHETMLMERAQREANKERDRYTVQGLEETVTQYRSRVEADPTKHDEVQKEIAGLIEMSPLPPAMRSVYRKKVTEALSEAAATSIADGVRDRESYDRAKELLAPHRPDRVTAKDVAANIKDAGGGHSIITIGSGARFRVAAPYADRFAGLIADLEELGINIKGDQSGGYNDRNVRGSTKKSEHAHGAAIDINWSENARGRPGDIRRAIGEDKIRELAAKHGLIWGGDWNNPDDMHFEVDRNATPAQRLPKTEVQQNNPDAYAGPYANLPLAKRRAIMARADQQWQKVVAGTEKVIKEQMSVAADGYVPPKPVLDALEKQVIGINDPMLTAQYETMLARARATQDLQKAPPLAIEEMARRMRDQAAAQGVTKEQDDAIKHVEKVGGAVRKAVNDNPMGWAMRTGIEVPLADGPPMDLDPGQRGKWKMPTAKVQLEPLNFDAPDIDDKLMRRFEQAKGVGRYYNQPPQAFTTNEREFLKDALRDGGPRMLDVFGRITKAAQANGIDPTQAVKEITKDPEVAMIGLLVAEGADRRLLDDAAKSLHLRKQEGDKFVSQIDKAQTKTEIADLMPVLKSTPGMVDPVVHLANAVYEYRHRREGKTSFDGNLYRSTVREILGETKIGDVAYGGPGRQGAGWFDAKWSTPVIVPPGVRQDSFDTLIEQLRPDDLELTGQPLGRERRPLSIQKIRSATWVSVGNGRYGLQFDTDPDGTAVMALDKDGGPFVMDLNPVMGRLRQRKPEIFAGAK